MEFGTYANACVRYVYARLSNLCINIHECLVSMCILMLRKMSIIYTAFRVGDYCSWEFLMKTTTKDARAAIMMMRFRRAMTRNWQIVNFHVWTHMIASWMCSIWLRNTFSVVGGWNAIYANLAKQRRKEGGRATSSSYFNDLECLLVADWSADW